MTLKSEIEMIDEAYMRQCLWKYPNGTIISAGNEILFF